MSKEGEEQKHIDTSDVLASENSESEPQQRTEEEGIPPGVSEQVLQMTSEGALVEAIEQYAWKKLKYPPFSVSCVQEVNRWIKWAVQNNMQALNDADVRSDLVRILHEGCMQYCERVADEILLIGVRSAVDDHVVQFATETTQQKDVYLWHRIFNECEIYNVPLLRNVLKSPPQLERFREVMKQYTQKSDVWINLTISSMDHAFTQLSALAGVTALARSSVDAARFQIPDLSLGTELDPETVQRHAELQRAMMVRPFMESDSAAKRRRKGWTTEEEEYIRQCIKLYKLAHPDKKTKRAPNELVHFIRSQPGAHVLQDGHELDQNIKNKINDIYKKGFMYET